MQRKQYCQSRSHPIVAILEAKNFKVKYDFLKCFRVPAGCNNNMQTMTLTIICVLVLKFDIEIP